MSSGLIQHIKRFVSVREAEANDIASRFTEIDVPKKCQLLAEGEVVKQYYFVDSGCLRLFFTDEKGIEQTVQFALENWWMTDLDAFHKTAKASFCIQSIEPSMLAAIDKRSFDTLLTDYPVLEKYFRLIYERAYAASLFRMKFLRLPKEEAYDIFNAKYPGFVQRLPQKLLASFLGFTPEYLSELRKKKAQLKK